MATSTSTDQTSTVVKGNGRRPFDVVLIGASAGGHTAIPTILRSLPSTFRLPIVIMQHLAALPSDTVKIYSRTTARTVEWIDEMSALQDYHIYVAKPRTLVTLMPDGGFIVEPSSEGINDRPIDVLFESAAQSFGERAIGIVLTGMLDDGASGGRRLHLAGGPVIVEDPRFAEFAEMPSAAISAGSANYILRLSDMPTILADLAAGRRVAPPPKPDTNSAREAHAQRDRADDLAEIDRAKIEFFSNVSHEFRTPLTLLLAPLEELADRREELPDDLQGEIDGAVRNGRRLLKLVNHLLDFSQSERRRDSPKFEGTDLPALTEGITSAFGSAMESAGLEFRVTCHELPQPIWIDREMWEKVISNLLSNALKFTFEGGVYVNLRPLKLHAELVIHDTGIGIPKHELHNLFKRFHRVHGARARTLEGSGIGLSMTRDMVNRMGGQISVQSTEGRGTSFTIWMPYESARITGEPKLDPNNEQLSGEFAVTVAEEASRWLRDTAGPAAVLDEIFGEPLARRAEGTKARILVADDSSDLRDYLRRLLSARWEVELVSDGNAAMEAAKRTRPDLILADVMMSGIDGFELLKRVREDQQLRHTPVIFLTARAGEEAAVEGLFAGADDYIAKPFSPRELMARVQAVVDRAQTEAALRASEERLAVVFETLPVGVGVLDASGSMILSNNEMRRFLPTGTVSSPDKESSSRWRAVYPDGSTVPISEFPGARALRGESVPGIEILYRQDDGTEIWTNVTSVPLKDAEGRITGAFTVVRDIDAVKRSAEALRESREKLSAEFSALERLHEASKTLWRSTDLQSGLEEILDTAITLLGADMGNVQLLNHKTQMLEIVVQRGFQPAFLEFFREVSTARDSACGRSLRHEHRIIIEDVETDPESTSIRGAAREAGYRAVQSTPLIGRDGGALGMLSTHFRGPHLPTEQDLRRLDLYVQQAVDFIERHRTEAASG